MNKFIQVQNLIGNTPIVYLEKISKKYKRDIFLKLESKNAGGSVKDRVAYYMIDSALKSNAISKEGVLVEPTSGNTGIGLAFLASYFGLDLILVMPDNMSLERRKIFSAYGAKLILTPASGGMTAAIDKAKEIVENSKNAFMPDQFSNPACIAAHYENTAVEIEKFMQDNKVDFECFAAGVGTGATISGVGMYLKEKKYDTKIIAVEPSSSPVLSGEPSGVHGIQGIGAGFVPANYNKNVVDEICKVSTEDAYTMARELIQVEGVSCGISTGANLAALLDYAANNIDSSKPLLTISPDNMDKYLSTNLFNN